MTYIVKLLVTHCSQRSREESCEIIYSIYLQGGPKTDTQYYFWDNFGNSSPILTILSLLQAEIYGE